MESAVKRLHISSFLVCVCLILAAASLSRAQYIDVPLSLPTGEGPLPKVRDAYPQKSSLPPPVFTIPVAPLGFTLPGNNYLLRRQSLVSLDFLDEDRLLFTFHTFSGLRQRDIDDSAKDDEQHIRAVVVALPNGKIESDAAWVVPDRLRYLWMIKDGHFLLRVHDGLDQGDSSLKTTPFLRFPGRLLWLEMDPKQQVMVTNNLEPAVASPESGTPAPPAASQPNASSDGRGPDAQSVLVARTLKRESGEVMSVNRFPWTSQTSNWPMNSEGYLERIHDTGRQWILKMNGYAGGDRVMAHIDSTCPPKYSFIADAEFLVSTCVPDEGWRLTAMSTSGDALWKTRVATNAIWPLQVMAPDGLRFARETLLLKRTADRYKHLIGVKDLEGQVVRVHDAANGNVVFEAPLTPMLDAGGNVAISPSGLRVAILNGGAIQVYQLPPPAPKPGH
jgi:hypothetical protein